MLRRPTRDLAPIVRNLGGLAPDLQRTFSSVRALEPAARTGLPALAQSIRGLEPVLKQTNTALSQANPILQFFQQNQATVGDFFTVGASAFADTTATSEPGSPGHYLRQFGVNGVEAVGVFRERLPTNRGSSYTLGTALADPRFAEYGIPANWDCRPSGGERRRNEARGTPACWVTGKVDLQDRLTQYPRLQPEDYSKP